MKKQCLEYFSNLLMVIINKKYWIQDLNLISI